VADQIERAREERLEKGDFIERATPRNPTQDPAISQEYRMTEEEKRERAAKLLRICRSDDKGINR
jgi:hypothetical protein